MATLRQLIEMFQARHPRLTDPTFADNQCQIKTSEFVDEAIGAGLDARIVRVRRHRGKPPIPGSIATISREVEHLLAVVDGTGIDFTRRQFDPGADLPTLYDPLVDLGRDWVWINDDPHGDAPWQELPKPPSR